MDFPDPNTIYVPSNTGYVMVKSKNSAPNSPIGGSMNNINTASTSTPNLAPTDTLDHSKGQLPGNLLGHSEPFYC